MNYIFSNVYKFAEEKDFVKALDNIDFHDGDTLIFLNKAVPLDHASNFFQRFNIISLHRIHIASTGDIKWFGEEEMLRRMDEYRHNKTDSQVPPSDNRCISMFYLDNAGVVKDRNGNVFWNIGIEDYPVGKMPTTGFYAYNFALQCLKGGVTLVNFYGSQDGSTNKWNGHDWDYEELVLKNVPHRISISPPNWKPSDADIKREATGSVKTVPWRDMGEADITSLWRKTWGEKLTLANVEIPKVSVVMPVYNSESYLSEALASVLLQKAILEVELICIDDGSSDNSAAILGFWENSDPRLKVIRQENQGPGVARNVGLGVAKGEYICFLDADDRFSSDVRLDKFWKRAVDDNLDILVCGSNQMLESGTVLQKAYLNESLVPVNRVFGPESLGNDLYQLTPQNPWSKLYRRKFLTDRELSFPPLRRSEDFAFVQLAYTLAKRIGVENAPLVDHRIGIEKSCEATKDDTPLLFFEGEKSFRVSLMRHRLLDKFKIPADISLVRRLSYNLGAVRRFDSFIMISEKASAVYKALKRDVVAAMPSYIANSVGILDQIVDSENNLGRLAELYIQLRIKSADRTEVVKRELLKNTLNAALMVRDAALKERDTLKKTLAATREVRDNALKERDLLRATLAEVRGVRDAAHMELSAIKDAYGKIAAICAET